MRRLLPAPFLFVAVLAFANDARADEWQEFEAAREAYNEQDYRRAAEQLEALVGGDEMPTLNNDTLLLESRKYLAASYLFLDRREDAREQFRLLLERDMSYQIDPIRFPRAVVELFASVRAQVQAEAENEAEAEREAERERRQQELTLLLEAQDELRRLRRETRLETVERVNSRWLAALPFGIGQFRNDHRPFGTALAVSQSILVATSLGTFFAHTHLPESDPFVPSVDSDRLRRLDRALRITNWASVAAAGSLIIVGIVDAQVRFQPVVRLRRQRVPSEDGEGEEDARESSRADLQLSLGAAGLRLRF